MNDVLQGLFDTFLESWRLQREELELMRKELALMRDELRLIRKELSTTQHACEVIHVARELMD